MEMKPGRRLCQTIYIFVFYGSSMWVCDNGSSMWVCVIDNYKYEL